MDILSLIRLSVDLIFTKIFYPKARIIRRPVYIRNEGSLILGKDFSCGPGLIIELFGATSKVEIGKGVMAFHNLHIGALDRVIIGDRVLIASGVYISDHSHGNYSGISQSSPTEPPVERELVSNPIEIGNDVWIGENVSILPGVKIGKGSIIGAGAVVNCDVPNYCIAAGVPAKLLKRYSFEKKQWILISENEY
ncbi:DapH/DapD/GlmU-related protein [Candidatus Pseudothioglobus singularis]|nr:DapH/DapD/GlmU-related protein [Candidatus Pseudothioglobus singularis]